MGRSTLRNRIEPSPDIKVILSTGEVKPLSKLTHEEFKKEMNEALNGIYTNPKQREEEGPDSHHNYIITLCDEIKKIRNKLLYHNNFNTFQKVNETGFYDSGTGELIHEWPYTTSMAIRFPEKDYPDVLKLFKRGA